MLFEDEVAVHGSSQLQSLMDRFANVCTAFRLTISLKKNVLAQATTSPLITIKNYELEILEQFKYFSQVKFK